MIAMYRIISLLAVILGITISVRTPGVEMTVQEILCLILAGIFAIGADIIEVIKENKNV